jgi:hypothetical protein
MMKLHFDGEQNPAYCDGFMTQEGIFSLVSLLNHCLYPYFCTSKITIVMFSTEELAAMLAFYEEEKVRVASQLKHIEQTLRKLKGKNVDATSGAVLTRIGTKAKKRGPKSVWGKFILEQLEAANKPMPYKTLIDNALIFKGLDSNHYGIIRASILNSAFRLRSIQGKIATVGQFGKKEKYLVLTAWLDEQGVLSKKHRSNFIQSAGGEPESVDMSSIPRPRYEEDMEQ